MLCMLYKAPNAKKIQEELPAGLAAVQEIHSEF